MEKLRNSIKSVRVKLFLTLSCVILIIIAFLVIVNNFVLAQFYVYTKTKTLKAVYQKIDSSYATGNEVNLETELEKVAVKNNFDILIKNEQNANIYTSSKDFLATFGEMNEMTNRFNSRAVETIESGEKYTIKKMNDNKNGFTYIVLSAELENGYLLYIRIPVTSIQESVNISNSFLFLIAGLTILIAALIVSLVSKKFTEPISELSDIARNMSNLDFSQKYETKNTDDEINNLGKSINTMSNKLESTIKQLKATNTALERDIEEKYKIDEMRKSFISDVSHELKTPIALIQGYSEGLIENVNNDEENRKFYAEVILDETNKMDRLVKQLLELMKLEYGKRDFKDKEFNIVELEKELVRKSKVMLEEKEIEVEFITSDEIKVFADDFYIEQIITNYLTNAVKHVKEINGKKQITIENEINIEKNIVRIKVINTGEKIEEENIEKIWNRFYKIDESRNRSDGGTGIGLALVKAIMSSYQKKYGVINREDGVEFYFELELKM